MADPNAYQPPTSPVAPGLGGTGARQTTDAYLASVQASIDRQAPASSFPNRRIHVGNPRPLREVLGGQTGQPQTFRRGGNGAGPGKKK